MGNDRSTDAGRSAIYGAARANLAIALLKGLGAFATGSAAMASEAIHSLVDTGNQALLLVGMREASKEADSQHNFGYGGAMFFWVLVVGVCIFGLGAATSLWEGISRLSEGAPLDRSAHSILGLDVPAWALNLGILAAAVAAEGRSCWIALAAFAGESKERGGLWRALRDTKDPTVPAVIVEDAAALAGLAAAALCQGAAYAFDIPMLDPIGSIAVGLILAFASVFLIVECRSLTMNEALDDDAVEAIIELAEAHPRITKVCEIKTTHMGPSNVLVCMSVDFADGISASAVESSVGRIRDGIESILAAHYGKGVSADVYINVESLRTFGEGFIPDLDEDGEEGGDGDGGGTGGSGGGGASDSDAFNPEDDAEGPSRASAAAKAAADEIAEAEAIEDGEAAFQAA